MADLVFQPDCLEPREHRAGPKLTAVCKAEFVAIDIACEEVDR